MPISPLTPAQIIDNIILVTSDVPPTRHSIPRSRLCSFSKTFEDMLSIPTGINDSNEVILTEMYEELELFIKVLKGEDLDDEYSTRIEDEDEQEERRERWIGLAKMADKYDCPFAAVLVKSVIWSLTATQPCEADAFYLAIALKDRKMIQHTSHRAIDQQWTRSVHVPQIWRERIEKAYRRRKLQLLEALMSVPTRVLFQARCGQYPECHPISIQCVWSSAVYASLQSYRLTTSFESQIYPLLQQPPLPLCPEQIGWLITVLRAHQPHLSEMLEIPEDPRHRTETPDDKSPLFKSSFFLSLSLQHIEPSAMSPFDVPEADKITLVTADDPPQRYIVSRSRLTFLSGVFRDLLSTPTMTEDVQKQEIPLIEEAEELRGFLMVLQDEEEKLSTLEDEEDWFSFARMSDKFDCKAASIQVLSRAWKALADRDEELAFYLATLIDHEKLIRRLGWTAVDTGWHKEEQCPARWTEGLVARGAC
ncbi:hypothetical protein JCM5353_000065 [Sporobolomyces roseus]